MISRKQRFLFCMISRISIIVVQATVKGKVSVAPSFQLQPLMMTFTISKCEVRYGFYREYNSRNNTQTYRKIKEFAKMSPGTDNAISNEQILDWTNSTLITHFLNFTCVMHNSEVKPP